jgi:uncharacterized protein (UPF0332 family)
MTEDNRQANAGAEAVLGDDALRAASALVELGLPNDAVSRAYYAAFHYARALLLVAGLEPKTHRGVISLLLERYEKPGRLEPGVVSILARLQTFRGLADYDATARLTRDRAEAEVTAARLFVEKARALLAGASVPNP